MIIDTFLYIKIAGRNIKYYTSIGYSVKRGEIIRVSIDKLYPTTRKQIRVRCDYCNKIIKKEYRTLMKERKSVIKKDSCLKCSSIKTKEHHLKLYGVKNTLQRKETKEKIKKTNLEKYGTQYVSQNEQIKLKKKHTFESKTKEEIDTIRKKIEKTTMNRYGVKSSLQLPHVRKNLLMTLDKGSSQQKKVYDILVKKYGHDNVHLNSPLSNVSLDVLLSLNNLLIDVEYDSSYWHNPKSDRKRDEFVKSMGYKVLRIKSGKKVPSEIELFEKIEKILKSKKSYFEIILSDWNANQYKKEVDDERLHINKK